MLDVHGGMGVGASWAAFLLFCLAKALHMGVFALAAGLLMRALVRHSRGGGAVGGHREDARVAGLRLARSGNAGIDMSVPLRLAPFTGVYGLSFVFAMLATALALALLRRPRRELAWLLALPLLFLLPALPRSRDAGDERAVLVQPNISETRGLDAEQSWTQAPHAPGLRSLQAALDRGPAVRRPDRVAGGARAALSTTATRASATQAARAGPRCAHADFLFGAVAHTPAGAPLNSAVLIGPGGDVISAATTR